MRIIETTEQLRKNERDENLKPKVYIDGQEGTTGLKIVERLSSRKDIELVEINPQLRKDVAERKRLINSSDFVFLCLPDDAAREAVSLVDNGSVRIIDASTAHRTNPDWAYGFPELSAEHRAKIRNSSRVSVPGCYATGFNALIYPLIENGVITRDFPVFTYAVSGYSGAGKNGIAAYENENRHRDFDSPRMYALSMAHKHLPEMQTVSGLERVPMFSPMICDYFCGMLVNIPLQVSLLAKNTTAEHIAELYRKHYNGSKFVKVMPCSADEQKTLFLGANTLSGTDILEIYIFGNDEQILLTARLDNLGKGASGAAVQCMNVMMGIDEDTGLTVPNRESY